MKKIVYFILMIGTVSLNGMNEQKRSKLTAEEKEIEKKEIIRFINLYPPKDTEKATEPRDTDDRWVRGNPTKAPSDEQEKT